MVNFIKYKDSPIKLQILKSRKHDFFRINPRSIIQRGYKKLVRRGFIKDSSEIPVDNPKHFISKYFIAHWEKTRFDDGDIHVGITISIKSTSKLATIRNLLRRRVKASLNENIRNFKVFGYDFVFNARPDIMTASYKDINSELKRTLKFAEHRISEYPE